MILKKKKKKIPESMHVFLLQHFKQTKSLKVSHDKDSIRFEGKKELGILYLRNKTKEMVVSQVKLMLLSSNQIEDNELLQLCE
jgi:hypothetical protein